MWKDIKNKFQRLFESDQESKEDHPVSQGNIKEERKTTAETKMTYRYPKQGEFRFPVIPDPKETKQEPSRPEPKERPNRERRERREPQENKGEATSKKKKPKTPEASSIPFTPSDVPSPVYGYHNRQLTMGMEKLEHTVESKIFNEERVHDEAKWQELRKRLLEKTNKGGQPPEELKTLPTLDLEDDSKSEAQSLLHEKVEERHSEKGDLSEERLIEAKDGTRKGTDQPVAEESVEPLEETERVVNETSELETDDGTVPTLGDLEETAAATTETELEKIEQPSSASAMVKEKKEEERETALNDEASVVPTVDKQTPTQDQHERTERKVEESREERMRKTEASSSDRRHQRTVPFNVIMTPRDKRTRDTMKADSVQAEGSPEPAQPSVSPSDREHGQTISKYDLPYHLLDDIQLETGDDQEWIHQQMELLETTLRHFHVRAKVVHAMKGPSVTRFEVQPEPGVKVSKITNLADDIKLSMAARDIRMEAPIPGKQAIGIEVPNKQSQMVGLQEIFEHASFQKDPSPLSVGLGLDIGGDPIVTNLKKMPHGLIAGATGSGKSVCINTILISLLYKAHYDDVKFLLIDPKMVELAPYNELPHLVAPVITDVKAATTALKWAVKEMEQRYEKFVEEGVRDVERYNDKVKKQNRGDEKLPYLVIVIDELADLMMASPQDVEDSICRIAQKARACGIHLLLATQRPSVDVITGLIKANIPTRIAFSVSSQVDSRTIIDSSGAEKLLGKGDMLFVENGSGQARRIQGAFVSDDEIERVVSYVKKMSPPQYLFQQEELLKQISSEEETDPLFEEAVQFVVEHNGASASLIQRRFKVGYNRAARLIDQMEDYGIISEQKGSKPRDVLLSEQQIEELINQ